MGRRQKNRLWFWASLVAINIAALLAFAEAAGNLVHYLSRGTLFYSRTAAASPSMPAPFEIKEAVFHPYFSFLNRVGRSGDYLEKKDWWTTNNHGFLFPRAALADGCCDYPYSPRSSEVIVAIFGGSVGGGFALTAAENAEFVAAVTRHPRFAGRRVRVLNFANSGYHQPQQLLVFSYYLALGQHFDLVINIDGFNEVVIAENNWRAGADPTFPAVQVWHAMGQELESRNPAHTDEAYFEAQWHKRASARLAIRADRCGLASCYLWYRGRGAYHDYRLARAERRVIANNGRPTLFPMGRSWGTGDDPRHRDILAFAADGWMRASRTMDRMARDHGALYLHVLQPNQWHSTGRPYQPIAVDHPYKAVIPLVEQGYPLLIRRASDLARQGIHVVDATGAFAGRADRDMFIDDCCHYTDEGYRILYGAVGDALAAVR